MIHIYDYNHDGYFKCDISHEPLWEGDAYIKVNGLRISQKWIDKNWKIAGWEDSSEADYINQETHERIENNGR